jgi:hypothetical protein
MALGVNVSQFNSKLERFTKKFVPKQFENIQHKIMIELTTMIIFNTPVLTGRARGNWYTSIGSPSGDVNDAARDPTGGITMVRTISTIVSARMGQTLWLANNLPYINLLEEGYSAKAPAGMVDISIAAIRSKYRI